MQAGDRKIGDPGQHVGEPGFWIDVVETTGRDQGEHDGGTIRPALGTGEGPVAAPQGDPSQGPFGGIVRQTNPAILQEAGKAIPALQHVVHGADHLGRSAERGTLPFQPLVHVIEQRLAFLPPHSQSFRGAQSIDLTLDVKQRVEPLDRFQRDRGDRPAVSFAIPSPFLDIGQFKEFPSRMRVTEGKGKGHRFLFGNTDRLKAIVTVTLQNAAIPGQVFLRMLAAAVTRSVIDRCRSRAAPEGMVIPHVGPDAPGRALAFGRMGMVVSSP